MAAINKKGIIKQLYQTAKQPKQWDTFTLNAKQYFQDDVFLHELDWHLDNVNDWLKDKAKLENKQSTFESIVDSLPFALFYNEQKRIIALNQAAESQQFLIPKIEKFLNSKQDSQRIEVQKTYFLFKTGQKFIIASNTQHDITTCSPLFDEWQLSTTEKHICTLLLQGYSIGNISKQHCRSVHTVRNQVKTILRKSGCNTQQSLIAKVYQMPFLNIQPSVDSELPPTQKFTLKDGRTLAWCERGDLSGKPVVLCHTVLQSRYVHHPEVDLGSLGIRLICPDRPGYGQSTPNENHSSWQHCVRSSRIRPEL